MKAKHQPEEILQPAVLPAAHHPPDRLPHVSGRGAPAGARRSKAGVARHELLVILQQLHLPRRVAEAVGRDGLDKRGERHRRPPLKPAVDGGLDDEQFQTRQARVFGRVDDGAGRARRGPGRLAVPAQRAGARRPFLVMGLRAHVHGLVRAEHQDVRHRRLVGRDLLHVFEHGGRGFGVQPSELLVLGFPGGVVDQDVGFHVHGDGGDGGGRGGGDAGGPLASLGLLKRLGERGLARAGGPPRQGLDLGPTFPKEIAEFPTRLHRGSQEFFIGGFALPLTLPQTEQHLRQRPARPQQRVRLRG